MPRNPSSPSLATTVSGLQPSWSHWPAVRASSRAMSRIIRCSSVRKSVWARASMALLGVLLGGIDVGARGCLHVGFELLRLGEGLHLRAENVLFRALERLGLLGGRVHLRSRGLAAGGQQRRRGE